MPFLHSLSLPHPPGGLRAAALRYVRGHEPRPVIQTKLAAAYASPDDLDVWLGALAEKQKAGMMVSETTYTILKDQFERLRDGDRFWYQTYLPRVLVAGLERQPLSEIIRRNTTVGHELQKDVFRLPNGY